MAKIHTTPIRPISATESSLENQSIETLDMQTISIEEERIKSELQATKRSKIFTDIVLGTPDEKLSLKYIFYPFGYLIITLILTSERCHNRCTTKKLCVKMILFI